ncbi:hypothetical protein Droror1_Dr00016422, partial [Drosera rotundifolia]
MDCRVLDTIVWSMVPEIGDDGRVASLELVKFLRSTGRGARHHTSSTPLEISKSGNSARIALSGSYGSDFELEGTTGTKRAKLQRLGVSVAAAWSVLLVRLRVRNSLNGTIKRTKHGTPIVGMETTGSLLVETLKSGRAQGTRS